MRDCSFLIGEVVTFRVVRSFTSWFEVINHIGVCCQIREDRLANIVK
jgi:hypothetical protein